MTIDDDKSQTEHDFENMESRWINDLKLVETLREHRKWVDSDGEGGKKADLSRAFLKERSLPEAVLRGANLQEAQLADADLENADLRNADLSGANLQGARLRGADLSEANLIGANLRDADLSGAKLYKAQLADASLYRAVLEDANLARASFKNAHFLQTNLRNTNLQNADLEGATGLSGADMAGADVSGSVLPGYIPEFKGLDIIAEASTNARKIFSVLLGACAFAWLTIATTTDIGLLTNTASSSLPIIQTEIQIRYFYLLAPLVLLCGFVVLHINMQRLWEALATQPARFRDGTPLDERAYPWLVIGLVRSHFKLLRGERPPLSRLQTGFTLALAYWLLPATLLLFWWRYLPRQEVLGTSIHILLLSVSTLAAQLFSHLTHRTLRAKPRERAWALFRRVRAERGRFAALRELILGPLAPIAVGLLTGALTVFLSIGAINGTRESGAGFRTWVPKVLETVWISAFARFGPAEVSIKPASWAEDDDVQLSLVEGAPLAGQSLRYLDARGAFLVKAELAEADLTWADFGVADLRLANLQGAILESAYFDGSKLQGADLEDANLRYAAFNGADLTDANLEGADLSGAFFDFANLTGVNLEGANLSNASFAFAILKEARLADAVLFEAVLTNASFDFAELIGSNLRSADLQGALFVHTYLINADLRGANLTGADFEDADLTGAKLEWTDLRDASGLTAAQVRAATDWEHALLPADVLVGLGLPADHNDRVIVERESAESARLEQERLEALRQRSEDR